MLQCPQMTNGGGALEEERCQKLTSLLGFEIKPSQFMQAHTILKSCAHKFADKPVLVLGGKTDELRKVAQSYGYNKAYTTLDVKAWNSHIWPFYDLTPVELSSTHRVDFSKTPIAAVFVFHDPRNWALDIQIVTDVILSGGIIGSPYILPHKRKSQYQDFKPVELIFCNPDLQWQAGFERPRLGQGAFRVAFQAVYQALTGTKYPHIQYGKPTEDTYKFAQIILRNTIAEVVGKHVDCTPNVYMIGDNPDSGEPCLLAPNLANPLSSNFLLLDIAGANAVGWTSILVRTGVYDPGQGQPTHMPTHITDDVETAVRWAIEREMKSS
ncbi:hypothetical protein EW146_g2776 [Bondarzewia mesenterica]|uniref:Uncharacterized protein n=1 Tax=Bondarzewia mesenterica TaxID=1095465 RepID=A0A4V3XFN0_9AGAM|nr:hypothetical protein EW146_g2776 [Bondarzewia mesenterica]